MVELVVGLVVKLIAILVKLVVGMVVVVVRNPSTLIASFGIVKSRNFGSKSNSQCEVGTSVGGFRNHREYR